MRAITETKAFVLECATCDEQVKDQTLALLRGWSEVEEITEAIPGCEELTHLGVCPGCSDGVIAASN